MTTKSAILTYLIHNNIGADNAILSTQLCSYMGLTNRLLRKTINELRVDGHPICSSADGYFYAGTLGEIDVTIAHLTSRAKEMEIARNGLYKSKINFAANGGDELP